MEIMGESDFELNHLQTYCIVQKLIQISVIPQNKIFSVFKLVSLGK